MDATKLRPNTIEKNRVKRTWQSRSDGQFPSLYVVVRAAESEVRPL